MGVFVEQLWRRDAADRALERDADEALEENRKVEDTGGAQEALRTVLRWMKVENTEVLGVENVDDLLECVLSPKGVMYEETDMHDDAWRSRSELMLAQREDGSYIACKPDLLGYGFFCPSTGEVGHLGRKVALKERGWTIYRPLPEGTDTIFGYLLMVLRLLSLRDIVPVVAAIAIVYALGLVSPAVNRWVLNEIVPQGPGAYGVLAMAAVAFLTAGFAKVAVGAAKTLVLGKVRLRVAGQAEASVMARALLLPQGFYANTSSGRVSRKLSSARQIADRMLNMVLNLGLTAVFSIGYIPQMVAYAPLLVIPAIAVLIVKTAFAIVVAIVNVHNENNSMKADIDSSGFLYSALKGSQKIRAMGAERRVYARWAAIYQRVLKYDLDQPSVLKLEDEITAFIASFGTLVLVSIVASGDLSRADYISFNAAYGFVVAAVGDLLNSLRSMMLMHPLMDQLRDILCAPVEADGGVVMRRVKGRVELDHVSFAYPGGMGAINDLSLTVQPGEKVAFVGESGCGKSTLLKLVLGAERPVSGTVSLDGCDLASLDIRTYRRQVGSVFQFSRLVPGTVRSNICFTPRVVSEEEAWEAAEKACIADDLRNMPLGLDTEISESNSCGFSGGQRQRILIARAFASKPAIMILDEATSALDNITQSKVLEAVYAEDCTVLMVAHRLSTVINCDRILVMDGGCIAEEGTYDELMARNGLFARLVEKQIQ